MRPEASLLHKRHKMNKIDKFFGLKGEARIRYGDGDYEVLSPGDFVRCAVTGQTIMLPDIRYWNVELQECYASSNISFNRYCELREKGQLK